MSIKINLRHRREWDRHGLLKYRELLAHPVKKCNVGEDEAGEFGEWYYVPDEPLPGGQQVVYHAYFGSGLPRSDAPWIFAEIFDTSDTDELVEFTHRVHYWQGQPERDQQP